MLLISPLIKLDLCYNRYSSYYRLGTQRRFQYNLATLPMTLLTTWLVWHSTQVGWVTAGLAIFLAFILSHFWVAMVMSPKSCVSRDERELYNTALSAVMVTIMDYLTFTAFTLPFIYALEIYLTTALQIWLTALYVSMVISRWIFLPFVAVGILLLLR